MAKRKRKRNRWSVSMVVCENCGYDWVAVRPITANNDKLECPVCKRVGVKEKNIIEEEIQRMNEMVSVVRCKDCKWYGLPGCAIQIVDDSDRPKDDDFCSFGERKGGDE